MKKLTLISLLLIFIVSCEKYQYTRQPDSDLEFYSISEFLKVDGSSKIINSTVKLSERVLIHYDEIISYAPDNYTFTITKSAANRISNLHGTAFALTIDKQIIYTGYFWAGYSSAVVDWVTIDPLNYAGSNQLRVQLGYPGLIQGDIIPDNRNNIRIIKLLERDNKLVSK